MHAHTHMCLKDRERQGVEICLHGTKQWSEKILKPAQVPEAVKTWCFAKANYLPQGSPLQISLWYTALCAV